MVSLRFKSEKEKALEIRSRKLNEQNVNKKMNFFKTTCEQRICRGTSNLGVF